MSIFLKALVSALLLSPLAFGAAVGIPEDLQKRDELEGISLSFFRDNVNWNDLAAQGLSFAYIAATGGYGKWDGTTFVRNADISLQATKTPVSLRSLPVPQLPVSFVVPTTSPFSPTPLAHSRRITLSPTVETGSTMVSPSQVPSKSVVRNSTFDLMYQLTPIIYLTDDTDDDDCYGLDTTTIVNWIRDFSNTYDSRVNRYPVIHTTTHWWNACTQNNTEFGSTNPLWIVHVGDSIDALPAGWNDRAFWQYQNPEPTSDGKERFNGDKASLER